LNWTDKYLCPLVSRQKLSEIKFSKKAKYVLHVVLHALLPHKNTEDPKVNLPPIKADPKELYDISLELYNAAKDRINKVEEKAFKLLSYISAISALLSFSFFKSPSMTLNIFLLVSLIALLLSLVISVRCINVKSIKEVFISDIYDFEKRPEAFNLDTQKISMSFLDCAIFNQAVADNTVDILKAARYLLNFALLVAIIPLLLLGSVILNSNGIDSQISTNQKSITKLESSIKMSEKNLQDIRSEIGTVKTQKEVQFDNMTKKLKELEIAQKKLLNEMKKLKLPSYRSQKSGKQKNTQPISSK